MHHQLKAQREGSGMLGLWKIQVDPAAAMISAGCKNQGMSLPLYAAVFVRIFLMAIDCMPAEVPAADCCNPCLPKNVTSHGPELASSVDLI